MEQKIRDELGELQAEGDIIILSAREMGSRLLNAANESSDWDVMFVYCFDEAWKYPATGYSKKSMEFGEHPLDFHGWNIDKFIKHLNDSNPMAMEFLAADSYREMYPGCWRNIETDAFENFNRMALYHHYISLAKSNYTKYIKNGNDCTYGRHFYVARALACAAHIRREDEFPPMDARELAEKGSMNDALRTKLAKFTTIKKQGDGDKQCFDRIGELYKAESEAPMMAEHSTTTSPDPELTNELLKRSLH